MNESQKAIARRNKLRDTIRKYPDRQIKFTVNNFHLLDEETQNVLRPYLRAEARRRGLLELLDKLPRKEETSA